MPAIKLSIELNKSTKIYQQGEYLSGLVIIETKQELKYEGISLSMEGVVDLRFNLKSVSFMDTFYSSNKTILLIERMREIKTAGRFPAGLHQIPFKFCIDAHEERTTLYETYHGVFISIQYALKCCLKRPLLVRDLSESVEIFIQYDSEPIGAPLMVKQPTLFEITPDSLSTTRHDIIPAFLITGQLDSSTFLLTEPITGEFVVKQCDAIIRSAELQLVRVETCGRSADEREYSCDTTEVQNIQIGDGDLLRNAPIQVHMILPHLFICPTLITNNFKIEFEINLVIIFEDNHMITENFPIKFIRSTIQPISSY